MRPPVPRELRHPGAHLPEVPPREGQVRHRAGPVRPRVAGPRADPAGGGAAERRDAAAGPDHAAQAPGQRHRQLPLPPEVQPGSRPLDDGPDGRGPRPRPARLPLHADAAVLRDELLPHWCEHRA